MAKRGFFAELNYQAQQAEKRQRQQQAAAVRAHNAAVRQAEAKRKAAERAYAAARRATEAQLTAAKKAAAQAHVEARLAEVEEMNTDLAETYAEIDGLLAATLEVDDFVDLNELKSTAVHPPFDPGALGKPTPPMRELVYPPEPVFTEPPAPSGLAGAFGGKKKHQDAVERARAEHAAAVQAWHESNAKTYDAYMAERERKQRAEEDRVAKLAAAQARYAKECRDREAEVEVRNTELARLVNNLAFDVPEAIEEYIGIVLANSVYPEAFPVTHEHTFDLATRELTLTVTVPDPSTVPRSRSTGTSRRRTRSSRRRCR